MTLKAILFDLGGTLINTASPSEIIRRILGKYGFKVPLNRIEAAHRIAEEKFLIEDYRRPYYEFWIKWNKIILNELNIMENSELLAKVLVDEWWDNADVNLYPNTRKVLVRLREMGLKIGVISNAFRKDIEEILARINLVNFFDVEVGIDSVGKPKPHREIFLYALKALGIKPSEALFVGDSLEKDYFGALNAGLKAVLLDRNNMIRENVVKIRDLVELLNLIEYCY